MTFVVREFVLHSTNRVPSGRWNFGRKVPCVPSGKSDPIAMSLTLYLSVHPLGPLYFILRIPGGIINWLMFRAVRRTERPG